MRATLERTYKEVLNFRYEGGSHVQVDGEPATAFAAVATMKVTDDIMKFRVVSIFRNKRFYMFVFGAPIDEFPRFDPVFKKILQNYHFRTPRKKNTPPLIAPADAPAKNPGTI